MADYTPRFGVMDGNPVRYTPLEAYWFVDGEWLAIHPHEVGNNASELSEHTFAMRFPNLPALPKEAFSD